jgi:hypothetical protein
VSASPPSPQWIPKAVPPQQVQQGQLGSCCSPLLRYIILPPRIVPQILQAPLVFLPSSSIESTSSNSPLGNAVGFTIRRAVDLLIPCSAKDRSLPRPMSAGILLFSFFAVHHPSTQNRHSLGFLGGGPGKSNWFCWPLIINPALIKKKRKS